MDTVNKICTCVELLADFFDLKKQFPWLELLAPGLSDNEEASVGVTTSGRCLLRSLLEGELVELPAPSCSDIFSEDRKNFRKAATTFSFDLVDMVPPTFSIRCSLKIFY